MRVLPNVTPVSQVQATHARPMLCEINYGKYLQGETRSFCINCLNVSDITLEQTNKFLCTTNFSICRAEFRCEEVAISKAEIKSSVRGCSWIVRIRCFFGRLRLSDVSPSQRRDNSQSSLGVCAATWVCDIPIFILNNSFKTAYIHLLLHIRPTTPRANACRSILVQARADASFVRETGDGRVMRVPAYFATPAVSINEGQEYDIDTLKNNLLHKVDQWNKRGSDFNIERVWAGSSCPRSFARRTFWRANTVSSTSKTTTRNASFGACCRRYTQPPITHIVCQSTKITNTISKSRGWLSMSKRNKSPFSVI